MGRHSGANGAYHSSRQKGRSRRSQGAGTYSKKGKARWADSYLQAAPWIKKGSAR